MAVSEEQARRENCDTAEEIGRTKKGTSADLERNDPKTELRHA